ncbi:hypothetical protein NRA35_16120 [Acinetobacter baumannii]|nr:hypothetical protein [Acinetobacter baumannii]MDC5101351.1 hypothetical protein [Acinetobacter baumannii]
MSKNKQERKERNWQNFEITSIFLILVFITAIWKMYPGTLLELDEDNTPVTVASRPGAHEELPSDEQKSYFEKIGEKYGTYGDAYGSLNTLFSGWAFALLLISLFMQRRELQEQRKELAAQRDEISKSNEIAESQRSITEQQAKLLAQQSFYSLLFKLLDEKNNKINLFYFEDSFNNQKYEKSECFIFFSTYILREMYHLNIQDSESMSVLAQKEAFKEFVLQHYNVACSQSGNLFEGTLYFEHLLNILVFIDQKSNPTDIDSNIAFLKSYISHDELVCIASVGLKNKRLYKFIEKYGLLEHFDADLHEEPFLVFQMLYEPNAFRTFTPKEAA